jgi:hypothetical protein
MSNSSLHKENESEKRIHDMLKTALGPTINTLLDDPDVTNVRLNPNGKLFYKKLKEGKTRLLRDDHQASGGADHPDRGVIEGGNLRFEKPHYFVRITHDGVQVPGDVAPGCGESGFCDPEKSGLDLHPGRLRQPGYFETRMGRIP